MTRNCNYHQNKRCLCILANFGHKRGGNFSRVTELLVRNIMMITLQWNTPYRPCWCKHLLSLQDEWNDIKVLALLRPTSKRISGIHSLFMEMSQISNQNFSAYSYSSELLGIEEEHSWNRHNACSSRVQKDDDNAAYCTKPQ